VGAGPLLAGALAAAALAAAAPPAQAQVAPEDPRRWRLARVAAIPTAYSQGIAAVPGGLAFSGTFGLFATGRDLRETARVEPVIPQEVNQADGYNHVGDVDYDRGRLVLPLECYVVSANPQNTCGTGAFAVADPATLQWRFRVKLDPAFIKKAMWVEAAGDLLWTQSGRDLLAYRSSDLNAANVGVALRPARRLRGAAPDPLTGAAYADGRLYGAVDRVGFAEVWSFDLRRRGRRRLEIRRRIVGESEGLALTPLGGGTLQWTIMPIEISARPPTYGRDRGALLSFTRRVARPAPGRAG
jgi:hypothetical protein